VSAVSGTEDEAGATRAARLTVTAALVGAVAVWAGWQASASFWPLAAWSAEGWRKLLWLAGLYGAASALLILWKPWVLGPTMTAAAAAATIVAAGPKASGAVLLICASAFALGRRLRPQAPAGVAVAIGVAVFALAAGVLARFPVNSAPLYLALAAAPLILNWRVLGLPSVRLETSRGEATAIAAGLFPLLCQWGLALKPEAGPAALSMHLATPLWVVARGRADFDVAHTVRAAAPLGGECGYTVAAMLGGEAAVRLFNFVLLVVCAAMVYTLARRWAGRAQAWTAVALAASLPLAAAATGSARVDNFLALFVLGAVVVERDAVAAGMLAGAGLMVNLAGAAYALPLALAAWRDWRAAAAFCAFAVPAYAEALWKTGSAVAPALAQMAAGATNPAEGWRAWVLGAQTVVLPPVTALAAVWNRRPGLWRTLGVAVAGGALAFALGRDMIWLYPAAMALAAASAAAIEAAGAAGMAVALACVVLGVGSTAAVSPADRDFWIKPGDAASYVDSHAPVRRLVETLNRTHPGQPVLFLETQASAGLYGRPFSNSWQHARFLARLDCAEYPSGLARLLEEENLRFVIAPELRTVRQVAVGRFLEWNSDVLMTRGGWSLRTLRPGTVAAPAPEVAGPGEVDDAAAAVGYTAGWTRETESRGALEGTSSWSATPGAEARLDFRGSAVECLLGGTAGGGAADVWLDRRWRERVTLGQARRLMVYEGFTPGEHTVEVRVASGRVVVDGFRVR
jgi:hypothetical protein